MSPPDAPKDDPLRAGLVGADPRVRRRVRRALEARGVTVAVESGFVGFRRELYSIDAMLIDLEGADEAALDALEQLVGEDAEPMVFVESGCLDGTQLGRVADKLRTAAAEQWSGSVTVDPVPGTLSVWVLGASFGGPQMLKRFLGSFRAAPDAAFIIAQHIGEGFTEVLAHQLHRSTPVSVVCARPGMQLESGSAYVAPVTQQLRIDDSGCLFFVPDDDTEPSYRPSIDAALMEVARRYGERSGAIVFSGMGADGTAGCRRIAGVGGTVWVQDSASCAIDSMPRSVRAVCRVGREGTPEELAAALTRRLRQVAADRSA